MSRVEDKTRTVVRLRKCATIHAGQHILENDYNSRGEGIGYLTGPADFGATVPEIRRWTKLPKAWAHGGDVLITVKGAGVGKTNLAPAERVAIGRQLMAIRPGEMLSQVYLFYYLRLVADHFQRAALGATVPGLGIEDIAEVQHA